MLNRLIEFSIRHRVLVISLAIMTLIYGAIEIPRMDVDVLPDLNRPVVTVLTEAHGLAPEEVESLISFPIETMMNGATGVQRVRSSSSAGLSIVFVEFDWGTDIFRARQIVTEKLQLAQSRLPQGAVPSLAPISSIMGEIMLVSLSSEDGNTPPMELRSLTDFIIRPRLLAVPGVSQVVAIGGGTKQFQVLTNPARLKQYDVTLDELVEATRESNVNAGGGFLQFPPREAVIRITGRALSLEDISATVVKVHNGTPITIGQVADVVFGPALPRGDASVNGERAVILSIQKQPDANTLILTKHIDRALEDIQTTLPPGVFINRELFRQENFIKAAIGNVEEALIVGGLLVFGILLAFLMNIRLTFISFISIPLSFVLAMLALRQFGISINSMTLGGLAIAIGLVVDDSIVDVENVFRRLKENSGTRRRPPLRVIYEASAEIRNSIVFATLVIILVFVPLLSLEGMEGRVFQPLGLAFIFSMLASLLVALTVTPALSAFLLRRIKTHPSMESDSHGGYSPMVRLLRRVNEPLVKWSLRNPWKVIGTAFGMVLLAAALIPLMGREFLPKFNEGSLSISVILPPETGMDESNRVGTIIEKTLLTVPEIEFVGRRTGRAEMDEHALGVNNSEFEMVLNPSSRSRDEVVSEIRAKLDRIPGVLVAIGQPISHRLDHLSSGVRAALAVKVYGHELDTLRRYASQVRDVMSSVPGVVDLSMEQQVEVPQVLIKIDRQAASRYGVTPGKLAETLDVALGGHIVSQILQGQRAFDLVVWFDNKSRNNTDVIGSTLINTADGKSIPLKQLASIQEMTGPNTIYRENVSRRIAVQANVQGRDLNSVVKELQTKLQPIQESWAAGFHVEYGGQFESQQKAMKHIAFLGLFTVIAIYLTLYTALKSWRMALQVMVNLPLAMVGGVIAVFLTGGVLSVASMVGFITLFGIATRNGIMLLSHYVHLMREEKEPFGHEMILRGTQERLSPVLMTALAAALGLLPLALAGGQPGKELLQPLAVVILGGLISSTALQFVTPALFSLFGKAEWERYVPGMPVDVGSFDELSIDGRIEQ